MPCSSTQRGSTWVFVTHQLSLRCPFYLLPVIKENSGSDLRFSCNRDLHFRKSLEQVR